jgi:Transmembrane protein
MLVDFTVPMLRVWSLFSHFLLTTGLVWTKTTSIQTAMSPSDGDAVFRLYNKQYQALLGFGLFFLLMRGVALALDPFSKSLRSCMNLVLDFIACFFISWMILDGATFQSYGYIFAFCV